jgi:hypothetical protein
MSLSDFGASAMFQAAVRFMSSFQNPGTGILSEIAIFRQLQVLPNLRGADEPRTSGNHLVANHLVDARLQNTG